MVRPCTTVSNLWPTTNRLPESGETRFDRHLTVDFAGLDLEGEERGRGEFIVFIVRLARKVRVLRKRRTLLRVGRNRACDQ